MSADDCRCYAESHCCLTLQMAEMQLQQPRDKLFSSFMTLASDSGYDLLSFRDSTVETDGTTRTSIVVEKCSNSVEPSALYALRQRSCPTSANAAPRPRRFQPKLAPQLREYPLHARATLSAASPQPPKDQLQQKQQAPPQEAKHQPQTPPQMPKPQQPTPVKMEVPSVREPLLQVDQNQPPPSLKKMPEDEDSMPASVVEVKKEASPKAPTAAPTGGKKQLSLFGAQPPTATTTATPTVATTKRQRAKAATTGEAVEAPKRKAPKVDSRSLTKLAKASAKKGTDSRPPPSMNVLDDDDEELAHRPSHSSQSSAEEVDAEEVSEPLASVFDDAPLLDVAVTSVNDEIVMLDDAPPMAFLAATQKTSPSPPSAGEAAAVPADSNHSQRRLNAFFSTDVVAFQKTFQRELVTETKMEDGEYICVDVVRFRSKATNELITEAEYHRRTAEVLRQEQEKLAAIPATSAAAPPSDASPSPAAPSRPPVAKQAKKVQEKEKDKAPTEVRRNLMSFFKQCSN